MKCAQCGGPLTTSPSADFCSERCQQSWQHARAEPLAATQDRAPDERLPETAPVRGMGWLAPERSGRDVLDAVVAFVARFSAFPDQHCAPTLALWYAHTHIADRLYVTPRLVLDSAEPGSGKTRVLEVAQHLVAAPEMTISATPAALFRLVSSGPITILFDEVDAIFTAKAGGANEDLRALLNAGYKASATVARCVGDTKAMTVQRFKVYAPAALAGIAGAMPATITTRAITIHMRRRRDDEHVDEFWEQDAERDAAPIRAALATWTHSIGDQIANARSTMPPGVRDRSAEIWRPLLAIADAAGDHWPTTARDACRHFVLGAGPQVISDGTRLLADLRHVFTEQATDRMPTSEVLPALIALDESPWGDLNGRPVDARRLARELGRYGVRPVTFDSLTGKAKGYVTFATAGNQAQVGLADAWSRYLSATPATDGNPSNRSNTAGPAVTGRVAVTDESATMRPASTRQDAA
jgi:hypothetical protein